MHIIVCMVSGQGKTELLGTQPQWPLSSSQSSSPHKVPTTSWETSVQCRRLCGVVLHQTIAAHNGGMSYKQLQVLLFYFVSCDCTLKKLFVLLTSCSSCYCFLQTHLKPSAHSSFLRHLNRKHKATDTSRRVRWYWFLKKDYKISRNVRKSLLCVFVLWSFTHAPTHACMHVCTHMPYQQFTNWHNI